MPFSHFLHHNSRLLTVLAIFALANIYYFRSLLHDAFAIARMPFIWNHHASSFLISNASDNFDLSFANYSQTMDSSLPNLPDLVPPILHHIALGGGSLKEKWIDARQSCLEFHPGWEAMLWTDENAAAFVAEHFPELLVMWDRYRFPIQRIDALRYMVLYHYGGVVLDMDLKCTRSLGPLRQFGFVAPAAHPAGFSIGFMMASLRHPFVAELVHNLKRYNRNWVGLPYPTVMFSTGCHYASTIHTLTPPAFRATLKILAGPSSNPRLHSLNGDVVTPLFHHLGTSSWHSYDASFIVSLGKWNKFMRLFYIAFVVTVIVLAAVRMRARGAFGRPHKMDQGILAGRKLPPV